MKKFAVSMFVAAFSLAIVGCGEEAKPKTTTPAPKAGEAPKTGEAPKAK
jgi:hypothetical protein